MVTLTSSSSSSASRTASVTLRYPLAGSAPMPLPKRFLSARPIMAAALTIRNSAGPLQFRATLLFGGRPSPLASSKNTSSHPAAIWALIWGFCVLIGRRHASAAEFHPSEWMATREERDVVVSTSFVTNPTCDAETMVSVELVSRTIGPLCRRVSELSRIVFQVGGSGPRWLLVGVGRRPGHPPARAKRPTAIYAYSVLGQVFQDFGGLRLRIGCEAQTRHLGGRFQFRLHLPGCAFVVRSDG